MTSEFFGKLSQDFSHLLEDADDYNVRLEVGRAPEARWYYAHSVVLRARSSYFRAALSKEWAKVENGCMVFRKENVSPAVFEVILRYMYSGKLSCNLDSGSHTLEFLLAADEMQLEELLAPVQAYLLREWEGWIRKNLMLVRSVAYQHEDFGELRAYCDEIFAEDPVAMFDADDFKDMEEDLLIALIERTDMRMDETHVWDRVLEWGRANTPNLPDDVADWTSEHFAGLRNTLEGCMTHVRLYNIPPADFYYRVRPFKKILNKEVYQDIVRRQFVPDSKPTHPVLPPRSGVDSVLIGWAQVLLIASWIDRKSLNQYYTRDIPYTFKLLLRGTRDGFRPDDFHARCDRKGPTVVVLRVADTREIVGGYNPIDWESEGGYKNTSDSFLFRLVNDPSEMPRVSRVRSREDAIGWHSDCGPDFGMSDLCMQGHFRDESRCYCRHYSYGLPVLLASPDTFSVNEYEVFQVRMKQGHRPSWGDNGLQSHT